MYTPTKRKRPSATSRNAAIARASIRDEITDELDIPTAIKDYNHYIGSVDIANRIDFFIRFIGRVSVLSSRLVSSFLTLQLLMPSAFNLSTRSSRELVRYPVNYISRGSSISSSLPLHLRQYQP